MIKKRGVPEVGEFVLCTVKSLLPHCAFVTIDDYESLEGMLHVSEVSLRGVRNIKDYLSVSKNLVCKVLRVYKSEIDVSLKRVKNIEMKRKLDEERINKRIFKLIEHASKTLNLESEVDSIILEVYSEFGSLSSLYDSVKSDGVIVINNLKINPKIAKLITESFNELLEQLKVSVKKKIEISCLEGDGIVRIKKLLLGLKKGSNYSLDIHYVGSPKYSITITSRDYKTAESSFNSVLNELQSRARELEIKVVSIEK